MTDEKKSYQKLSGNSLLHVQTVYLSEDHLLVVNGRYSETFRRLYFKDIEAVLIKHTRLALMAGGGAFITGLIMVALTYYNSGGFGFWAFLVLATICLLVAGVNAYGKGSSVFGVKTGVQTVILHGLNSRRRAQWAEAMLVKRIEAVQGKLSIDELREAIRIEKEKKLREKSTQKSVVKVPPIPAVTPPPLSPISDVKAVKDPLHTD